jgi:hypothetical protein
VKYVSSKCFLESIRKNSGLREVSKQKNVNTHITRAFVFHIPPSLTLNQG